MHYGFDCLKIIGLIIVQYLIGHWFIVYAEVGELFTIIALGLVIIIDFISVGIVVNILQKLIK